jgi:hypothetical protein
VLPVLLASQFTIITSERASKINVKVGKGSVAGEVAKCARSLGGISLKNVLSGNELRLSKDR